MLLWSVGASSVMGSCLRLLATTMVAQSRPPLLRVIPMALPRADIYVQFSPGVLAFSAEAGHARSVDQR